MLYNPYTYQMIYIIIIHILQKTKCVSMQNKIVALLQTSTRTLQWGPLTLSRENLHPLATSNKSPNPAFTWLPSLHTIVIIIGRPGFFSLFLPHACHILLSFYTSNTASCNNDRCNQFKATCHQSKMKIWDAFSYE